MGKMNLRVQSGIFTLAFCITIAPAQQSSDPLALARSQMDQGKLQESAATLRTFLVSNPTSADAHFLLGYILFRDKKAKESLGEFTEGAKYRHPRADDLKVVASDYVILSDFADADTWFTAVVKERPEDSDTWYLLGRTKYNESDFVGAVSSFEHALASHPRYVEAENNLGLCWRELGDLEKAKVAFKEAIGWQGGVPNDAQPFLNLGTLLSDQNDFEGAIKYLVIASSLSRENPTIHEQLGDAYREVNKFADAQKELERAVALAPNSSGLHYKLGQIYRRQGLRDRAEHELEICAKLNQSHSSTKTPNPAEQHPASPQ